MHQPLVILSLLAALAAASQSAHIPSGSGKETGTTTINFLARAGIDETLNVLEGADELTMTVLVHVHAGHPKMGIDVQASVTHVDRQSTRRGLASQLAAELKEQLVAAGVDGKEANDLVHADGGTVTVSNTPQKGANTGDFDDNDGDGEPDTLRDPPNGQASDIFVDYFTTE